MKLKEKNVLASGGAWFFKIIYKKLIFKSLGWYLEKITKNPFRQVKTLE